TYTGGTTTIAEGTLRLNKPAGGDAITAQAIQGGDNGGAAGADQLVLANSNQINDGATITVQGSGAPNLNNQNEPVNNTVTLISGISSSTSVATGTGTLTVNNNTFTLNTQSVAFGGVTFTSFGNVSPVTVSGTLALQTAGSTTAANRTITTNDTIADVDLLVTAKITDGDGNATLQSITATGSGRLELAPAAASDFSGTFTVGGGRTRVSNSGALGLGGTGAGTVANGGSLELNGVT